MYKRVPHITLKSIANNEEIDAIHAKWQEKLEPLRAQINQAVGKVWQEWEVPPGRPPPDLSGGRTTDRSSWLNGGSCGGERQKEIDASIARRADTEQLYDQPYEDNKRIRVTRAVHGREPVTAPGVIYATRSGQNRRVAGQQQAGAGQFEAMILDNLRAAGVQNTVKNERLKFTRLEPYAGTWLQAMRGIPARKMER